MPAHAQTRYAAALEKMSTYGIPATFGEVAKTAWFHAHNEWIKFGGHEFISPNEIERNDKLERDRVQIDQATQTDKFDSFTENQLYWANRWSDQMNYRYWKERSKAELTTNGVLAHQMFYEGTVAYKTGDFPTAADKFKEGLAIWKVLMDDHPAYRDDELSKKETGHIVKRYVRVLKQNLTPVPKDLPFKEYLPLVEHDNTPDPFDTLEMLGPIGDSKPSTGPSAPAPEPTPGLVVPAIPKR